MNFLRRHYSKLIFLLIGLTAGFFISRLPLEFEPKTNWVSLASFFLTIFLAVYLEFVVRPSFSNNRNEKDLLIEQLKEIRIQISEIQTTYINIREINPQEPNAKSNLVQNFRNLSNQIDLFKQMESLCTINDSNESSEAVIKAYLLYKRALTGKGFDKSDFFYDRLYWKEHDSIYRQFIKAVIQATIEINKK